MPVPGNMTAVPYVIGDDVPTAERAVGNADLIFEGQRGGSSPRLEYPIVVKTTPPAGTSVQKGTYVTCIIDYPDNSR
jgi:beta-lactam-binding protein with PASTA domain